MIRVEFVKTDFDRVMNALSGVKKEAVRQGGRLPFRCAVRYKMNVSDAIVSNKYKGRFKPYTPKYEKWKLKTVGHLDFWRLYGDLLRSLATWKINDSGINGWVGGVAPGATNREGKLIRMYAEPNEALRPLFRLERDDFEQNDLKAEGVKSMAAIGSFWR